EAAAAFQLQLRRDPPGGAVGLAVLVDVHLEMDRRRDLVFLVRADGGLELGRLKRPLDVLVPERVASLLTAALPEVGLHVHGPPLRMGRNPSLYPEKASKPGILDRGTWT